MKTEEEQRRNEPFFLPRAGKKGVRERKRNQNIKHS